MGNGGLVIEASKNNLLVHIDYSDESILPKEGKEIEFYAPIYGRTVKEAQFKGFMRRSYLGFPQFFTKGVSGEYDVRIHNVTSWRYVDENEYKVEEKALKPCD